jgi:periplasmic protein TonB
MRSAPVSVFLRDCLVEGDSAQEKRVRRNKQRALLASIVVQILLVIALVLFPLFTKGENITSRAVFIPAVPYSPGSPQKSGDTRAQRPRPHTSVCRFCAPTNISPTITLHDQTTGGDTIAPDGPVIPGVPGAPFIPGLMSSTDSPHQPADNAILPRPPKKIRVSEPVIQAKLVRRVEPGYPPLAVQLRREGRVELHAIISTDGTIQSLEVINGDPLFLQSALAAVRQWRYQPTILDGQPIEVDTHITVVYTLSH